MLGSPFPVAVCRALLSSRRARPLPRDAPPPPLFLLPQTPEFRAVGVGGALSLDAAATPQLEGQSLAAWGGGALGSLVPGSKRRAPVAFSPQLQNGVPAPERVREAPGAEVLGGWGETRVLAFCLSTQRVVKFSVYKITSVGHQDDGRYRETKQDNSPMLAPSEVPASISGFTLCVWMDAHIHILSMCVVIRISEN